MTAAEPTGRVERRLAIPTADGRRATPIGLPQLGTLDPTPAYVVRDILGQARTFMDAPVGLFQ